MSILAQPTQAPTASPAPRDQRVRLVLEAEIFQDPDGGPDSLIVTTDERACEPTVPARLLRMVAEARAQLDAIERIANVYEAEDTIRAICAEHDAQLEEWDAEPLDPKLRERFVAFAMLPKNGRPIFVVPEGQDPIERAAVLADLVNSLTERAHQE
ncbi:hypothetical protein [Streptomyces sp. NPDC047079]|uniref:hypothetical protein n=1 Tax=Streptomyces sp. NPDC047079 TaxID=3154607 RepID=UPI0033E10774